MSPQAKGLAHSVQVRLLAHARAVGISPELALTRYAVERVLYRLSRTGHAEHFVLKGALMMLYWLGEAIRPTRDADLLRFGDISDEALTRIFADTCAMTVEPDGIVLDATSIRIAPIRQEDAYGGKRVTLDSHLGSARVHIQIDVGIGDAVIPEPEWIEYPSVLGFPRPRLRAYRPETSIAEKFHAMVVLGSKNSRMRDFFDIQALARNQSFDGDPLVRAIRATFARRDTPIPDGLPFGLTAEFAAAPEKQAQWAGFRKRSSLSSAGESMNDIVAEITVFLRPVIEAATVGNALDCAWSPGGPWVPHGGLEDRRPTSGDSHS